jgi:hypothetical protein
MIAHGMFPLIIKCHMFFLKIFIHMDLRKNINFIIYMHTWIFLHQFDHDTCQNNDEWTHATLHAIWINGQNKKSQD